MVPIFVRSRDATRVLMYSFLNPPLITLSLQSNHVTFCKASLLYSKVLLNTQITINYRTVLYKYEILCLLFNIYWMYLPLQTFCPSFWLTVSTAASRGRCTTKKTKTLNHLINGILQYCDVFYHSESLKRFDFKLYMAMIF